MKRDLIGMIGATCVISSMHLEDPGLIILDSDIYVFIIILLAKVSNQLLCTRCGTWYIQLVDKPDMILIFVRPFAEEGGNDSINQVPPCENKTAIRLGFRYDESLILYQSNIEYEMIINSLSE